MRVFLCVCLWGGAIKQGGGHLPPNAPPPCGCHWDWLNFCRECRLIPRRLEGLEKWWRSTSRTSQFGKRKYITAAKDERVHVERGSDKVFMQIIPSRDAATLLPWQGSLPTLNVELRSTPRMNGGLMQH